MTTPQCDSFRRELERALSSREGTRELGWHRHLFGCSACRQLLQSEEALEELLATLPAPHLPSDLAQRVLARLQRVRVETRSDESLDRLLELGDPHVPEGLAEQVLLGLAGARSDARLDGLLDRLPTPELPAGLGARVLDELAPLRRRARFRRLAGRVGRLAVAAAILVALVVALPRLIGRRLEDGGVPNETVSRLEAEDELLRSLDVLENWELLVSEDLDLTLAELDPVDWALIEHGSDGDAPGEERGG